ncbi:helix-hairpin-helix domain-containing protein [Viridibacillus soli]|uniref:helix-hairpin-helix domain-containing protein n=1 Tax=Viridibacillus soli TaxID=2798301 RepID=UPI002D7EFDD8|nr:helix-hairpin-helix domain-containing protein [Viridibacillus soli]
MILSCFFYFYFSQKSSAPPQTDIFETIPEETKTNEQPNIEQQEGQGIVADTSIIVDVKGAVKNPGVYSLSAESRVIDAILLAGGYAKNAESVGINHAQRLQDEMVIYVPKIGEEPSEMQAIANVQQTASVPSTQSAGANPTLSAGGQPDKVNLNTADEAALMTLNGVGPAKAKAILSYRDDSGPFKTIEDIKNVTGIGDKTFENLRDYITVQ